MSTLYRAVLIESTEQAAQMPEGTLARHAAGPGMDHAHKARPLGRDLWLAVGGNCTSAEMVGWEALVPIEVEDLIRDTVTEALAEQAHQKAEADKKRQEFNDEVRRLLEEKYLGDATARVSGFTPRGEA